MIIDEIVQQPIWMSLIMTYLDNQSPSNDNVEVERITHKFRMYYLINGVLY
jgi:hypothetical protein